MDTPPPRILLVEDHGVVAHAIAATLRSSGFPEVDVADIDDLSPEAVLATADRFRPHLAVVDLSLGEGRSGVPLIGPLVERGAKVVILTATTTRAAHAEALQAGALGVLDKAMPFDQLVAKIRDAAEGRQVQAAYQREQLVADLRAERAADRKRLAPFERLTARERGVLGGLIEGRSPEEIAGAEGLSLNTVRSHIKSILSKLGVRSQLAAVARAREAGWTPE